MIIFLFAYTKVPGTYYLNRDDGIITLSHAKNLVDYGTISINPSGERIEGFSAPLHFLAYVVAYGATGISFSDYSHAQTFVAAFLLGFLFVLFFPKRDWSILAISLAAALALTWDFSFLGWHGSGMENALTHVMMLLTIYLLYRMLIRREIRYIYVLPLAAASIVRTEAIFHIAPLLVLFVLIWHRQAKSRAGIRLVLLVLGTWIAFNTLRYMYFGNLLSNTALAQDMYFWARARAFAKFDAEVYAGAFDNAKQILLTHHGAPVIAGLLAFAIGRRSREVMCLCPLLGGLFLSSAFHPFVFGEARIDPTRTSTHVAVASVLFCGVASSSIIGTTIPTRFKAVFLLTICLLFSFGGRRPYYLGWDCAEFEHTRREVLTITEQHRLPRPMLANPDLGMISWYKHFNIFDLGRLGNPVLASLSSENEIADYFFELAAPDVVELHASWAIRFAYLLTDPRFIERYEPIWTAWEDWLEEAATHQKDEAVFRERVRTGLWIRKDVMLGSSSHERRFIEKLERDPSVELVRRELASYVPEGPDGTPHYIVRTVYRFLPEFCGSGQYRELLKSMESFRQSLDLSLSPLYGRVTGSWYRDYTDYIRRFAQRRSG
jgi:hypothetical protein